MAKIIATGEETRAARAAGEAEAQRLAQPTTTCISSVVVVRAEDYEIIAPGQDLQRCYSDPFVGKEHRCQNCECTFKLRPGAQVFFERRGWARTWHKGMFHQGGPSGDYYTYSMTSQVGVLTYGVFRHEKTTGIFVPCPACGVRIVLRKGVEPTYPGDSASHNTDGMSDGGP